MIANNTKNDLPSVSGPDKEILRGLARRVAEIAAKPVMAERIAAWKRHNGLHRVRPMILLFPEGAWRELLPQSVCTCQGEAARGMEWNLRHRIYTHEHFDDDTVIEATWPVGAVVRNDGWGLEPRWHWSDQATGARTFDPVVQSPDDLKKFKVPKIWVDEEATAANLALAHEVFDGVLEVRAQKVPRLCYHLMSQYTALRGLEQVMMDMIENPQWLHDAMAFLEDAHHQLRRQYVELNLLSLNNDNTYNNSGGVSWTDELPKSGFDPSRVRTCDVWSFAEAQEMAQVSPEMHNEFILQYEKRLLEPFGLTGYGCCEDLTRKLDYVFTLPHLRRISISPWANVDVCAEKLQDKYVFSWKPHPAQLAGRFDADRVRQYIRHTLEVSKGCIIEMILKDTHTCDNQPQRFDEWTKIAREEVNRIL